MEACKVLVLGNENFLRLLKSTAHLNYTLSTSRNEALAKLRSARYSYLIVLYSGIKNELLTFAKSCSVTRNMSVLVVCKQEIYDQVQYQLASSGIIVLSYPIKKQLLYQAMMMLESVQIKLDQYESKITRLEQKYLELKMVDHCKLVLISNYHWSEEKAHHYIEKMAMDQAKTKLQVAKELLEEFSK